MDDRRNWVGRLADYERPWVGRVGLALIVALWLFVTVVGFAVGVGTGLAFLILGGALIAGEVWIERSAGRHATFALVWRLTWRIAIGVAVIISGVLGSDGWAAVVAATFGSWLILTGVAVATFSWLQSRETAASGNE